MSNTHSAHTTNQGTPLPPGAPGQSIPHGSTAPVNTGQPQVPAGVPSSVPGATGTAAPAPTPVDGEKPKRKPQKPPEGRIVSSIPPATKKGVWDSEMEWLRQNPGVTKVYEDVAQTTPSYIKATYGVMAYGRNTRGNRVDMYCYFDPEVESAIKKDKSIKPGKKAKAAEPQAPAPAPTS